MNMDLRNKIIIRIINALSGKMLFSKQYEGNLILSTFLALIECLKFIKETNKYTLGL